jgi:uncharacterized protein YbaR (Trm112 family)
MLLACPHCRGQLNIPDNAAGMQLQCPMCKGVFQAPAAQQAVRPAPQPVPQPPQAPPLRHAPSPAPAGDPFSFDQEDSHRDRGYDDRDQGYSQPRRYYGGPLGGGTSLTLGATLLIVAAVVDLILSFVMIARFGLPGALLGRVLVMWFVISGLLFILPSVFMFVAAGKFRQGRAKGLVITGCILAIVAGAIILVLVVLALASGQLARADGILLMNVLLRLGAGVTALISGIMTLVSLGNPRVQEAFARNAPRYY